MATQALRTVVVVGAQRTPMGTLGGALSSLTAPQLGAVAIAAALKQGGVKPAEVDEIYFGNVLQANVGQAPARQAAVAAGLPPSVVATTINKVCASGMKSVALAAMAIRTGEAEVVVAGGMESMSNAPHMIPAMRFGRKYGDDKIVDAMARDGLRDPWKGSAMGDVGEICAKEEGFSREDQDRYAARSFANALAAQKEGKFKAEICPVEVKTPKGVVKIDADEIKSTSLEKLAQLRPAFNPPKTVTAGNASTINDGAAALVLMSEERARKNGHPILAVVRGWADAETDPEHFTIAPSLAMPKALARAQVTKEQLSAAEVNEAFAVVALANQKRMGIPLEILNKRGGAISLGHPLGASGARILCSLIYTLKDEGGRFGIAGICNGGGGASAMVLEVPSSKSKM